MPNNRKSYKLSEVTTKIGSGATPRGGNEAYKKVGISLIRSQNVLDFKFSTDGLAFIDDEQASKLNNVTIAENDVLLNITGDSVARVCKVPKTLLPARVNQHVAIVRANINLLDANYLKYSLLENTNKSILLTLASAGATRNALTKGMIEDFELKLPPLPEQKAIASILSTIDDKIENNLAINKTLEDMAMALYKHWFVDFGPFQDGEFVDSKLGPIPKGWEIKRLDEIIEIKRGGSPRPIQDFMAEKGLPWLKISDATASNSPFLYSTKEFIKKEGLRKTVLIKSGSIILSNSATPGLPIFIEFDTCVHDGWLHFPKINRFNRYILYLLFLDIKEHLIQQGNGSVFTNLKTDILKSQLIKLPDINIENDFSNQIAPWFEEIRNNTEENLKLSKLRDTLLPKLISGEVRLKEFREQLENVI